VLLVHSDVCGSDTTLTALRAGGLDADVVEHHRGPLGPLLSARRAQLEARGQLAPGQRLEDVLVLRGRQVGRTSARWPIPTP
jgi:release factor glutamine methyltransferase